MRELDFIEWIRSQGGIDSAVVPVGPGDDCAVVKLGGEEILVTADQVLDGVHFVLAEHGPEAVGRKAMARGLSDAAAMAAMPLGAVATIAMPKDLARDEAEAIYRGLRSLADEFDCPVVGGDVGVYAGPLAVTVTVFARPGGVKPVLRSGAEVNDAICTTGSFGGAWRSRRHLQFIPRIREARMLAARCELHAMIDVSDGLSRDLGHICRASGVGAEIVADDVPVHPGEALEAALGDGEDYELLFTLSAEQAAELVGNQPLDVPIARVGTILADEALIIVDGSGSRRPLEAHGWEHETQ